MMENEVIVIGIETHEVFGEVTKYSINGKPYFKGIEIAERLGYKNPSNAVNVHCKHSVKASLELDTQNRYQGKKRTSLIPIGDVVRLIVKSKLPKAQEFECWVMDQIVPSVIMHGGYIAPGREQEFMKYRLSGKNARLNLQICMEFLTLEMNDSFIPANITNMIYQNLFDKTAQELRLEKGLSPQGNDTRDICFTGKQLRQIKYYEDSVVDLFKKNIKSASAEQLYEMIKDHINTIDLPKIIQ